MSKWSTPTAVSDAEVAFPTTVDHLMPSYADVPSEFKSNSNKFVKLVMTWFYSGLEKKILREKNGIDRNAAFRHLRAIMGSWEPKHEHKMAGVAYLLSLWFDIA